MRPLRIQTLLLMFAMVQMEAMNGFIFGNLQSMLQSWKKPEKHRTIRLHLEDDEELIVPKDSKVKVLSPDASERFYAELARSQPPKFLPPLPVLGSGGKLIPGLVVDGNPFHNYNPKDILRPISVALPIPPITNVVLLPQHKLPENLIKPVEERIQDDLKYDFRTKTHSV